MRILLFLLVPSLALAEFPSEGRWSVATSWESGWPSQWNHASPTSSKKEGDWTLHEAEINLTGGALIVQDAQRTRPNKLIEVRRRWEWTGSSPLETVTLSFRWQVPFEKGARPFLPGISYYDNPAGQSVDPSRIPVISASKSLRRGFYEEHRFPQPFASAEGLLDGKLTIAALHTVPSPVHQGSRQDQWWSLGVEYLTDSIEFASYSGPVASNGSNAVIKGLQRRWVDYDNTSITLKPGAIIEKTYFIESAPVTERGAGFQTPMWTAIRLAEPFDSNGFPPFKEVVALKFRDTIRRWQEGSGYAGIKAFPGEKRTWVDLAWAGQSEAYAYPMLRIGDHFDIKDSREFVQSGIDFITTSPIGKSGFAIRYDYAKGAWEKKTNPLSQAQAINNLLDAFRTAKEDSKIDTTKWEDFLRRACDFHSSRIMEDNWEPTSTNEAFLIAPLARGAAILDNLNYLVAAHKAAEHYAERHRSMDEPYWGGTLDARCEDKEGAWAAFQGFLAMHEATGEKKWLDRARHAADVVLTYLYVWDVPMPSGRLADHAFKSRGWTSVSVQNMHLDVYGVLCAPALWKLGELTGEKDYQRLARLMIVSCGQLLDPVGGHGEQIHQTNYAQHYDFSDPIGVRGDYIEEWNVYWLSAHFLVAAAQLDEMNVPWQTW